jgi:copper(I)-binding protein
MSTPVRHHPRSLACKAGVWLLTLASPLIAGCGAGFEAPSQQVYQPADGVTVRSGMVYVVNALVVTDGDGNGTVVVALINQADEPDQLISLTAEDTAGGSVEVAPVPPDFELPAGESVQTAETGTLRLSSPELRPGGLVTLTFEFEQAAPVAVEVPVLPQSTDYADVEVNSPSGSSDSSGD